MPVDSNSPPELSQGAAGSVPGMTPWEKFVFLFWPAWLTLLAVPLLAVMAFGLIKIAAAFLPNFHWYVHHPDRLKIALEAVLVILAYGILILGALLVYPALVFRKMIRRRKETGSVLPQGEELAARRWKKKNPSRWTRAWIPGFFALVAGGWTYEFALAPHRLRLILWAFPALMWVIATMAAMDCFFPRRERLWTGVCASGAFALLAAVYLVAAPHVLQRQASYWIFPFLTGSIGIVLAILIIRDWRRERGRASVAGAGS